MSPLAAGILLFASAVLGAVIGMRLRSRIPEEQLAGDSRDVLKVAVGQLATMSALVLGLLTASAAGSFDEADHSVRATAADLVALDRLLARIGPETQPLRQDLRDAVTRRIDAIWGSPNPSDSTLGRSSANSTMEGLALRIHALTPADELGRLLQGRAAERAEGLLEARWLASAQGRTSALRPFLFVFVFWMILVHLAIGVLAPRNGVLLVAIIVGAASIAGAVFLMLELDGPFTGLVRVSPEALRLAAEVMGQ